MKSYLVKKLNLTFLGVATLFLITSCEDEFLRGHGDVVSRNRPVGTFNAVSAGGEFEIFLTQGPTKDVLLEGQENVLSELSTEVRNNKLIIKYDKKHVKTSKPVRIYITTPELTEVSVSGANSVRSLTDWQVDDFDLEASGNTDIHLTLKGAQTIDTELSGSADIELNGDAVYHDIDISGSGNVKAFDLITKEADIEVSGSGKCEVTVSDRLKAILSGSGRVRYKGNPSVSTKISGSGSVNQVD
ncbi:hypothetical protein AHMF7605_09460 [Adhaeribacter arboris]|uniref:Putative auto-transporter adhesin head GIN domain-containing protein n=1 Tax=Adhaeribacter arboris TaxID=2072846 RepID=A0A2T2YDZ6_9BACT|nr:head GIN domain-containing protein [Adhaeribacter arboris]PSR53735.1 hypothetical protein AHMF7605_09460 [Adhaeribacter arboris]